MRTRTRYSIATVVWIGLVFAGGVALLSGVTEPFVSTSDLPEQELSVFVGIIVLALGGGIVTTYLGRRAWTTAGRHAGLTPEGGGLIGGRPDFTGRVDGRAVNVWTHEESSGHGEHKETHRYVVFEAELARPLEEGCVVTVAADGADSQGVNFLPEPTVPEEATLDVVGPDAERYAEAILEGKSQNALEDLDLFGTFAVGDANGVVMDALPASARSMLESVPGTDAADELERAGQANASTVSHTLEGLVLHAEEFERQVEAVVAVAEAVESAT